MAWHRIAAVNASKVERDGDLQTLKQFIADVAVGQVNEDDIDANAGLIKAFRLAQLQVQYVLHCQQVRSALSRVGRHETTDFIFEMKLVTSFAT